MGPSPSTPTPRTIAPISACKSHRMGWLFTLLARYDVATLRPPSPHALAALDARQVHIGQALNAWCRRQPGPAFAVAHLNGMPGVGKTYLADALCRDLDGSLGLDACPTIAARWRLKLRVKLADCLGRRFQSSAHPWDCGFLRETPAALAALARFTPRRATLIVADALPAEQIQTCIELLARRHPGFLYPVRLLVVGAMPPVVLLGVLRVELAANTAKEAGCAASSL